MVIHAQRSHICTYLHISDACALLHIYTYGKISLELCEIFR